METKKQIEFMLEMSPRGLDELKALFPEIKCSKYELPFHIFPENSIFNAVVGISGETVLIGTDGGNKNIILKGRLDKNSFQCRSVCEGTLDSGRSISAVFRHKGGDEISHVNPEIKKRLDMWYEYIDIMMKKCRENTYLFVYEGTHSRSGDIWNIRVGGAAEGVNVKNLNVGTADNKGEPSFAFGRAEKLENGILTVKTEKSSAISMAEWQTRIAVYDAASLITCRRMKNGLDRLGRGEAVNKRLTDFLFDPMAANNETGDNITLSEENLLMKNMNPEQLEAVEGVLNAKDLYLIQGPPGTGKTTVIAEICYQNAIRGLKTLVVSQSNLAVDNAISRVMNHSEVRVLRKGDASRVEDEGLPFVEDNVVRTWIRCVSESAMEMAQNINAKLEILKKHKSRLPEILRYAEDVIETRTKISSVDSQVFFFKNVLEEADDKRKRFFELINDAYELELPEKAYAARSCYPPDFKIPNEIYNDISEKFADIEADAAKIHELEEQLDMLSDYTAKFSKQMRFISRHVSKSRMENTAYEGVFHYIDSGLADNLYGEGEKIINSIPYGLKSIISRPKWDLTAAVYYRRAEKFVYGIQRISINLAAKINNLKTAEDFVNNMEAFRFSLDALCKDYDSQYYVIKNKYENMLMEQHSTVKDHEFAAALFKEKVSDKFFSAALEKVSLDVPDLDCIENAVNQYYSRKAERYLKWQKILDEWRCTINGKNMNYNELKQLYIDNANVIGITCIQSGTADFERNYPSFDVVIIDESSKSTPPDIIIPMLKGKKIVLVGDHKQLPPYIDSDAYDEISDETDGKLHELMKISLFEELYQTAAQETRTMLFRQYRMHRNIAALINQFYIDTDAGRLESPSESPKAHCCQGGDLSEDNHVLWYDIKNSPEYYEEKQNKSFYNSYEALCIRNILSMLNKNLTANGAYKSVGVITFYDAQVRLLDDMLINSGFSGNLDKLNVRTGSVDRFQGMEEDIIVISFVRNNNSHNIGFAKDCRRINVALSRARELLVIVGCSENFTASNSSTASATFKEIYNIVNRLDGIRDPFTLEKAEFTPVYRKNTVRSAPDSSVYENYSGDIQEYYSNDKINVLDSFILKAAGEFSDMRLSLRNISNALGIAPVFVKNRTDYLASKGYLSCRSGIVKILDDGKKMLRKI